MLPMCLILMRSFLLFGLSLQGEVCAPFYHSKIFNLLRFIARRIYEGYRINRIAIDLFGFVSGQACRSQALLLLFHHHDLLFTVNIIRGSALLKVLS